MRHCDPEMIEKLEEACLDRSLIPRLCDGIYGVSP
jgi:hypothetical protein